MSNPQFPKEINVFAETDFRNQKKRFGIKLDDRRRHMYLIGKTGMGKSTLLENMVVNDIWAGHGVALIDPHGDLAEKIVDFVPPERVKDIVYFNPADTEYPMGFNILESVNPDHRHLVASGLMGVFKKIWPDVWSARMEYILNNTLLSLLECDNTTLLAINRLLADGKYRKNVVARITDPVVRAFWINEFDKYDEKYRREAVAPIQNKIGQFLSAAIVRNIVAQRTSTINIRQIMDEKKIFIVNLSKGRIGEDASRLLGGMIITKIQLSAMERVDTPEEDRQDFFLYVDEFQNFATESFANILSEARKYRLSLIMAHQYVKQLDEKVADAVFGNVGTICSFRIGADDAEMLEREYLPVFTGEDIVNIPKFHVYLKLMIDGVASQPFSAAVLPPIKNRTYSTAEVIATSRKLYTTPRASVEEGVRSWSLGEGAEDYGGVSAAPAVGGALYMGADQEPLPPPPVVRSSFAAATPSPSAQTFATMPPRPVAALPTPAVAAPKAPRKELPDRENWFKAICGRCGNETSVPFPPDGKRKIYCKDCYKFRHEDEAEAQRQPVLQQPRPPVVVRLPETDHKEEAATPPTAPEDPNAPSRKRRRRRHRNPGDEPGFGTLAFGGGTPPSDDDIPRIET